MQTLSDYPSLLAAGGHRTSPRRPGPHTTTSPGAAPSRGWGRSASTGFQTRDVQIWLNEAHLPVLRQGKDASRATVRRRCCAVGRCCRDLPSPTTLDHIRRVLRAALSKVILDGYATTNAARSIRLPTIHARKRKAWTSEEARRFLESARAEGDRLCPGYRLVLVLGLRKGELLGLGWEAVELDAGTVAIDWRIQRVAKLRGIERRRTKTTSSDATLPLPPVCVAVLRNSGRPGRKPGRCGTRPGW
jgi:integrase